MTVAVAAQKPMHRTHRVEVDGAVDADGHLLEPPTLWEDDIDPAYRDRALRIVLDEHGLERGNWAASVPDPGRIPPGSPNGTNPAQLGDRPDATGAQ